MPFPNLRLPALLLAPLLFLLAGCGPKEQPVTPAEALQLAGSIERSMSAHDPKVVNNILDLDEFCRRIARNMNKKRLERGLKEGVEQGLQRRKLGNEMLTLIGQRGFYKLLRSFEKDGHRHLLFHSYGEHGLAYYDFELVKTGNRVKAADIFLYYTGEPLSETIGKLVQQMTGMADNGEADEQLLRNIRQLRALKDRGAYAAADSLFSTLPEALRRKKVFQLVHVEITSGLADTAKYVASLEEYHRLYPQSPNVPLLMIDAYMLHQDYNSALRSIEELNRQVGNDPLLDFYRALMHKSLKDTAAYIAALERLYRYIPDFEDGVIELISAYVDHKDYGKARPLISAYRKNPGFSQVTLSLVLGLKEHLPADLRSGGL